MYGAAMQRRWVRHQGSKQTTQSANGEVPPTKKADPPSCMRGTPFCHKKADPPPLSARGAGGPIYNKNPAQRKYKFDSPIGLSYMVIRHVPKATGKIIHKM